MTSLGGWPFGDGDGPADDFETKVDYTVRNAFNSAYDAAVSAYLTANAMHSSADTGCPRHPCVALPGAPCTDGPVGSTVLTRLHQARTKLIRRRNRLRVRLADAAGRAASKAYLRSVNKMPGDGDSVGWREKY